MIFSANRHLFTRLAPAALIVLAGISAGCSGPNQAGSPYFSSAPSDPVASAQVDADKRCKQFARVFDALVACQRSNGTLDSFSSRNIAWRVRYFVRHSEMPCHEAPTVEESYVYYTVINDLNADQDLNAERRIAIRTAMFEGKTPCKTEP